MVNKYFEATVKTVRDGKKVSEQYIMEAISFTDVETQVNEAFEGMSEFHIVSIKRSKIIDIDGTGEKFFKATIETISIDEVNGKEKKFKEQILFGAADIDNAKAIATDYMSEILVPVQLTGIVESKILEVL